MAASQSVKTVKKWNPRSRVKLSPFLTITPRRPTFKLAAEDDDWYARTKNPYQGRTESEELERRQEANRRVNGRREREDLYSDSWAGDEYRGSSFNILTVLILVSVGAPIIGVTFALATYGKLW
eukprot:CAMPEP_0167754908 /NCGR_PEP_ID=MMETSP0110_2-20121227/8533_1 /TAXON_ID=629695 /ORGANISM="Gymnochlora sp., Strain CCMP2014" /LENGTH=123 /DNA_ID=CAMNT_0007640843 /DNA_START=10 /DNA_END=378 /DNA_ORIENTATION=-